MLTDEQRAEIRRRVAQGERKEELAVAFGCHFNTIGNIAKGEAPRLEHEGQARTTSTSAPIVPEVSK
jgi:hypothetical protein